MKLNVKPDEEKKISYFTFVVDWNDPKCKEKINKIMSLCIESEDEN